MKFAASRYTTLNRPATIPLTGGPRPLIIEAEGSSRFDGLTPGAYTLRASSPDHPAFEIRTLKIDG